MTITDDLKNIEGRILLAQRAEAQAQVAREAAKERVRIAVTELKEEFGVTSVEGALALATQLEDNLKADLERISELLNDD